VSKADLLDPLIPMLTAIITITTRQSRYPHVFACDYQYTPAKFPRCNWLGGHRPTPPIT
jgi:hypothetical protein